MFLLDTNVVSELRKASGKANADVVRWRLSVDREELHLSVITIYELEIGILLLARRDTTDAMITATALVHGMTVVTRNVSDFQSTGVKVLNPWLQ